MSVEGAPSRRGVAPPRRSRQRKGRRRQWSAERVLAAAQGWEREVGVAPYAFEWDPAGARRIGREQGDGGAQVGARVPKLAQHAHRHDAVGVLAWDAHGGRAAIAAARCR
jgi:hypothetical protein